MELGIEFERNLEQVRREDQGDLLPRSGSFPFTIECKRRAADKGEMKAWRKQACEAAQAAGNLPAVVYRYDRKETAVSIPLRALCEAWPGDEWATRTLPGFCLVAREIMAELSIIMPNEAAE